VDGEIQGFLLEVRANGLAATADYAYAQLTFASQVGRTTNDDRQSIAVVHVNPTAQSGIVEGAQRVAISGLSIPVQAGERVYVYAGASGATAIAVEAHAHLYLKDGFDDRVRRR